MEIKIGKEFNPPERVLMGPGPSNVPQRVLKAMASPVIGHLDPEFIKMMNETKTMLRQLFKTKNDLTFAVSATGSAGMETCLVNLLEPGDEAVVCVNGVFGSRMCDIVERFGAKLIKVEAPWGQPINTGEVEKILNKNKPRLLAVVHAETSTGFCQPLEELSSMAHNAGALFVVDAVTSLGGMDVRVDEWGIDAIYSGTQKCLSSPPGLSPVSFNERALKVMDRRKTKVQSWYLDLSMLRNFWTGEKRVYHHTAPISSLYALYESLRIVFEEGLEQRFERHRKNHAILCDGLEDLGFKFVVSQEYRLPMLNAVNVPDGLNDAETRNRLLNEYNIEIGAGLGDFAGKVWRVGLMGHSCTENNINILLSALKKIIF